MARLTYGERLDRFDELIGEAKARSDADRALVSLLDEGVFDSLSRTHVVGALADTAGAAGSAALRSEFAAAREQFGTTKPHNRAGYCDLMLGCLWALGKRDGPGGTDVFVEAMAHANRSVRDKGLIILAAVGDDRAWDDMLAELRGRLAKKINGTRRGGEALTIIEYLARHCGQNADRKALLEVCSGSAGVMCRMLRLSHDCISVLALAARRQRRLTLGHTSRLHHGSLRPRRRRAGSTSPAGTLSNLPTADR